MLQKNYFALFGKENANNIHGTLAFSAEVFLKSNKRVNKSCIFVFVDFSLTIKMND